MTRTLCRFLKLALLFSIFAYPVTATDSFLADTLIRQSPVQKVLDHKPVKHYTSCHESVLTGPIETTMCDFETIESVNEELFGNLSELVEKPFFRYFQVDLYRECPFWPDDGSCNDPGCAITTLDEKDVPEKWRAKALSKVDPSSIEARHSLPGCYYRDSDFCFLDDNTEGEYFDLRLVPERYTGYSGKDAHRVWRSIYEENCFGLSELNLMTGKSPAPVSLPDTMIEVLHEDGQDSDPQCLEKRVYYKVISGLHASISTHICHEYLNQTSGEWHPNLDCFISRVASHPERLQYIYFDTILLLRAVARLGPYLSAFDYCSTGTHEDDAETLKSLTKVIDIAKHAGAFDETILFRGENANVLKEEFKTHFRNVTRIMDCVGCDKCRLWGKIQTTGIATALKILFELDEKALDPHTNSDLLQRSEVVALMNTLYRFSESLQAVEEFRTMWRALDQKEADKMVKKAEKNTAEHTTATHHHDDQTENFNFFDMACAQSMNMLRNCKDTIEENVTQAVNALGNAFNAVLSAFKPSGKERGPGYGEL
ncbi:endoplasmic oxidoreductin [Agrocybe pediades]|nr:endoplasmic oxidoreductin [Agrocybe pediades]